MVTAAQLLLAEESRPAAQALPEPVRQIALMALLGIALLGMLMIVATLLGGHWVRRWGDRRRRPAVPSDVMAPRGQSTQRPTLPSNLPNDGDTHPTDETIGN